MTGLADAVLPLIRTRADLYYRAANEHGRQMHEAVDLLEAATSTEDPVIVLTVTQKAIASALTVIQRADDSSGIIGDACARLLDLFPPVAARAGMPATKLVDWMIKFQFDNPVDYFSLDPVAYAPALGPAGVERYRARLDQIAAKLDPTPANRWATHEQLVLEHNAQRLAVLDRDIDAIITTHARDRRVAAFLHDTAKAFAEIEQWDLAIDWARQATEFDTGHQARAAGTYWCDLLAVHRPAEHLDARWTVFDRWPTVDTAARLHTAAADQWPEYQVAVLDRLARSPRDAVLLALEHLNDVALAWDLAHNLDLRDNDTWARLVKRYQKVDPLAVLPVLASLVHADLVHADARNYQQAARRLRTMRKLAGGSDELVGVDALILQLRETHRRRPRLQQEFDRAGLP
jgi:hypothetical protein